MSLDSKEQIKCPSCGGTLGYNVSSGCYFCEFCNKTYSETALDALTNPLFNTSLDIDAKSETKIGESEIKQGSMSASAAAFLNGGVKPEPVKEAIPEPKQSESKVTQGTMSDSAAAFLRGTKDSDFQKEKKSSANLDYSVLHRYSCPKCGSVYLAMYPFFDIKCAYCDTKLDDVGRVEEGADLDYAIPFVVNSKADAVKKLQEYCISKRCSNGFLKHIESLNFYPVYNVCLLAQADINFDVTFSCTKESGSSVSTYSCRRAGDLKMEKGILDLFQRADGLSPEPIGYNSQAIRDISQKDISTYPILYASDVIDKDDPRIKFGLEGLTTSALAGTLSGYDTNSVAMKNIEISNTHLSGILVPAWYVMGIIDGKEYKFTINAQSGACKGKVPEGIIGKAIQWVKNKATVSNILILVFISIFFYIVFSAIFRASW